MKHTAAQAHDQQRYKFLGSLSDDIFAENVEPEFPAKRLQQRRKSSSHGEIELPNIQKKSSPVNLSPTKSPSLLSPRDADPPTARRQLSNGKIKRLTSHLAPTMDVSSCPNSSLNPRNRKSDKLDINIGGSKGGAPGTRAPPGSKFFHFHAVFGKNVKNNSNFGSWRAPRGKSWIRH